MTLDERTDVEVALAASQPGWPRALVEDPAMSPAMRAQALRPPRPIPLPWINAINPLLHGRRGWLEMHGARSREADEQGLCFCCGLPLQRLKVMGQHRSSFDGVPMTDGPPGHPRCVALAATYCPHLERQHRGDEDVVIAYGWGEDGPGYQQVPEEMLVSGQPRYVVLPGARPLTLAHLRLLAQRDPLGEKRLDVSEAPRERDCRYGCCKAGDVELYSEVIR